MTNLTLGKSTDVYLRFQDGVKKVKLSGKGEMITLEVAGDSYGSSTHLTLDINDLKITEEWVLDHEALRKVATEFVLEQEQRKRGDRSPLEIPKSVQERVKKLYEGAPPDIVSEATSYAVNLTSGAKARVEYVITLNEPEDDGIYDDDDYYDACCQDHY